MEARGDMFKIENLFKRPIPFNTHDIGIWQIVMEIMGYLSAVSNIFIYSYSSHSQLFAKKNW